MGCLLSRFYDKSLKYRAKRRSLKSASKYKLGNDSGGDGFLSTITAEKKESKDDVTRPSSSSLGQKPLPRKISTKKDAKPEKKEYSWEKRRKLDPKDFMCMSTQDEVVVKEPGKINGQQFVIDGCARCKILVFDHCASVTIDDCEDCTIFIGPTESSIFIRNCKNCTCVFVCRQLRTRDCDGCNIKLFCSTRPVIESSKNMGFGCFDCDYKGLSHQLKSGHLSKFCNYWSSIYDFTPPSGGKNWYFLEDTLQDLMKEEFKKLQQENGLESNGEDSKATFKTYGESPVDDEYHYLVLFNLQSGQEEEAESASRALLKGVGEDIKLIQVNGCRLSKDEINEMNSSNVLDDANLLPTSAEKIVGVEFSCTRSIKATVVQAIADHMAAYDCILVGDLDLMRPFRTKGITG